MADDPYPLLRHAEPVMGTVVSFAVRTEGRDEEAATAVAAAVSRLHEVDARFSTYRADSEVSRIDAGLLSPDDASDDLRRVLLLCEEVSEATDGYFTVRPWGRFDPSGLVKGWAVELAGTILRERGFAHSSIGGGGDVQLNGFRRPGQPWVVGVVDPLQPSRILCTVPVADGAVATSGTAERGAHVVDPHTGLPATALASVTLVGRELTWVDACATAALAMGAGALAWVTDQPGLEALVVDMAGSVTCTAGWPGHPSPAA